MRTPEAALEVARSFIGKGTVYRLGDSVPGVSCDCSGFTCWVYDFQRHDVEGFGGEDGGWHYTTAMVNDALDNQTVYKKLQEPIPGCLIVYPGITQKGVRVRIGHVGVVSKVPANWNHTNAALSVIHCSSGNLKNTGDAIRETTGKVFSGKQNFRGMTSPRWRAIYVLPRIV